MGPSSWGNSLNTPVRRTWPSSLHGTFTIVLGSSTPEPWSREKKRSNPKAQDNPKALENMGLWS